MTSEAQLKAIEKYDSQNTLRMSFKFNKNTDADVIQKLNTVPSKQGYIKDLIRKDIVGS